MSKNRQCRVAGALMCIALLALATPAAAEIVWAGVWKDLFHIPGEETAQRFTAPGPPDLVLSDSFAMSGAHYNVAISGTRLYSARNFDVHQWNARTGEEIGPLELDSPLEDHFLLGPSPNWLKGIGTTAGGDLLFGQIGYGTQRKVVARYTASGHWLVDYTHPSLQHVQGTAAGNTEAVFIASRHDCGHEDILMFQADGTFVGAFGSELDNRVGDVAVMDDYLYALDFDDGIRVYALNGMSLPTYSHLIPFPPGVHPVSSSNDELAASNGHLYVGMSSELFRAEVAVCKIDLGGQYVGTYYPQIAGSANKVGSIAVIPDCPGDLNGDRQRDFCDFTIFSKAWQSAAGDPNYNPLADLNGDGSVDMTDFAMFSNLWLVPCP